MMPLSNYIKKDKRLNSSYKVLQKDAFLSSGSSSWLVDNYENFLNKPDDFSNDWKETFAELKSQEKKEKNDAVNRMTTANIIEEYRAKSSIWFTEQAYSAEDDHQTAGDSESLEHALLAQRWVDNYRRYGYRCSTLSPLAHSHPYPECPTISIDYWGLQLQWVVPSFGILPEKNTTVEKLQQRLAEIYNGSIGLETDHIRNTKERNWLTEEFEKGCQLTPDLKKRIFKKLMFAELLEKHLHNNFVGQKRFSLEGTDSLIPLLDSIVSICNGEGIEEVIIGMAHRGRLNVLINIMGKTPAQLFNEFAGKFEPAGINGDVKYHLGFSSSLKLSGGTTHLVLAFNPSHLAIVSPVVLGSTRARQERYSLDEQHKIIPINIHGDAAFSGQGVIMETLNMSQTRGFGVKGCLHIVVNNQIGFTIDNPLDARSTLYSSDPARFIDAPIIHVNADDPEAVIRAGILAVAYRQKYFKDIVIDLVGYRRHGHNEADDPKVTQPLKYKEIKAKQTTATIYHNTLVTDGVFTEDELNKISEDCRSKIENGESTVEGIEYITDSNNKRLLTWRKYLNVDEKIMVETYVNNKDKEELMMLGKKLATIPEGFEAHRQIQKLFKNRVAMAEGKIPMDWGFAENLAYASLLTDGYGVRLTGQDVKRGTFFHRHSVIHDQNTGNEHNCLNQFVSHEQTLDIYDSLLSEEAVLAYEYGYSTAEPETLLIWEAQFGDFANGAQVVIDQFISSGESKWGRMSGLVMLLPHGFEGQGPEHSSARLERYIQLCAQYNMQIVSPTTPAQIYHLLRRQTLRVLRKPLIVMSPKSLLRHPRAVSSMDEISSDGFKSLLDDVEVQKDKVKSLIFCSGKIYYQLLEYRAKTKAFNTALLRIEQLYPFPHEDYGNLVKQYPNIQSAVWCQEEPRNQGAWYNVRHQLVEPFDKIGIKMRYAGRETSASPAVGLLSVHNRQQEQLLESAFNKE